MIHYFHLSTPLIVLISCLFWFTCHLPMDIYVVLLVYLCCLECFLNWLRLFLFLQVTHCRSFIFVCYRYFACCFICLYLDFLQHFIIIFINYSSVCLNSGQFVSLHVSTTGNLRLPTIFFKECLFYFWSNFSRWNLKKILNQKSNFDAENVSCTGLWKWTKYMSQTIQESSQIIYPWN